MSILSFGEILLASLKHTQFKNKDVTDVTAEDLLPFYVCLETCCS